MATGVGATLTCGVLAAFFAAALCFLCALSLGRCSAGSAATRDRDGVAIVASVVLRDGVAVTADELREFCRGRLAPFKIPKQITFAKRLPRNEQGKLQRRNL